MLEEMMPRWVPTENVNGFEICPGLYRDEGATCLLYTSYHVRPYDGVVQMLDSLKKKGIKIAVFSNKPHLQAIDVVESTFGKGYFDHIQGQSGEFPKKPDPEGLLWILDKLGVSPEEGIYIGDSDVDMKTGKAVSYTHLDVYKRQVVDMINSPISMNGSRALMEKSAIWY